MSYDKARVGLRLKSLRIDRGYDQKRLSELSTVPTPTIQSYEDGTSVMGMENALVNYMEYPDEMEELLRYIADWKIETKNRKDNQWMTFGLFGAFAVGSTTCQTALSRRKAKLTPCRSFAAMESCQP